MVEKIEKKELNKELNYDEKKDIRDNSFLAAMGYIWILCFIPLFLKRKSKFAQFHAKQGLILFIVEIVGWLLFWIPVLGWFLLAGILILAVMGIMNSLKGEWWEMPILGKYAKRINL